MKIACLTYVEDFNSGYTFNNRLYEESLKRGHSYITIRPDQIRIHYTQADIFPLSHAEHDLGSFDMFNHAIRVEDEWAWEVVDCLRTWGKPIMRPARLPLADKVTMARLFTRAGIAFPKSAVADTLEGARDFISQTGYPVIGKGRTGSQGRNVRLINNDQELKEFVDFARAIAPNFLLQEALLPLGKDIRAFVVGEKVVASMERFAADNDFRANYSISGKSAPAVLTPEEERMAIAVTKLYEAPYAGVDIIRSHSGPVVIDINKAPGLTGIESTTGINVASLIVEHFEQLAAV